MMPTPAGSCFLVLGCPFSLPLPFLMMGIIVCSSSREEKYVVYPSASVSVLVLPCFVSCRTSMLARVLRIQYLSSCRLVIALIPLQLNVAMISLVAYGAGVGVGVYIGGSCPSCASGAIPCLASAGAPDLRSLAFRRHCCFFFLRWSALCTRAELLLVPL